MFGSLSLGGSRERKRLVGGLGALLFSLLEVPAMGRKAMLFEGRMFNVLFVLVFCLKKDQG